MRTALILHGNLRTFFMPLREDSSKRVCDVFIENIVKQNAVDIFAVTEANDFFMHENQHCNNLEICNMDAFRIHDNVKYVSNEEGRVLIGDALNSLLGSNLKKAIIEDAGYDVKNDEKFKMLSASDKLGYSPSMLVKQYVKIKRAYEEMQSYELENNFQYDLILKCRFDCMYSIGSHLNISSYDYKNYDVFVPGINGPVVYDWYAFGKRDVMKHYLNLYDVLGFTLEQRAYLVECRNDGYRHYLAVSDTSMSCPWCNSTSSLSFSEITMSSEYHLSELFRTNSFRAKVAGYHCYVYRYKDTTNSDISGALKKVDFSNIKIINHSSGNSGTPVDPSKI